MRTYNGYNHNKEYKQKFEVPIHSLSHKRKAAKFNKKKSEILLKE